MKTIGRYSRLTLFVLVFLFMAIVQPFSMPLFSPVIVTFDSSDEVSKSVETLLDIYPNAQVLKYDEKGSILNILTLMRSERQIILVGHGTEDGIVDFKGNVLRWNVLGDWLNSLPNNEVFFLSCNSFNAKDFVNKPAVGFKGIIDGVLSALAIGFADKYSRNDMNGANILLVKYVDRYGALIQGAKPELLVPCPMSISPLGALSSCLPPPPPPSTYTVSFTASVEGSSSWSSNTYWTVIFNGQSKTSNSQTISFTGISSGTYSFSVSTTDSRYSIYPPSGSLPVSSSFTKTIAFKSALVVNSKITGTCVIKPNDANYYNHPEYWIACMGFWETLYDIGNMAALITGAALLTYSSSWVVPSIGKVLTAQMLSTSVSFFITGANLLGVIMNHMSDVAMMGGAILTFIPDLASFLLLKVVPTLSIWVAGLAGVDITTQAAAFAATGGLGLALVKAVTVISILGSFIWWILGLSSDWNDSDDVANMPNWIENFF